MSTGNDFFSIYSIIDRLMIMLGQKPAQKACATVFFVGDVQPCLSKQNTFYHNI